MGREVAGHTGDGEGQAEEKPDGLHRVEHGAAGEVVAQVLLAGQKEPSHDTTYVADEHRAQALHLHADGVGGDVLSAKPGPLRVTQEKEAQRRSNGGGDDEAGCPFAPAASDEAPVGPGDDTEPGQDGQRQHPRWGIGVQAEAQPKAAPGPGKPVTGTEPA